MTRIQWHAPGTRFFETGVDRGVLYPRSGPGVPWAGITNVSEDVSGGEVEALYRDGVKYRDLMSAEDFQATLEAYAAPREFGPCEGVKVLSPGLSVGQQPRQLFGLSYRTLIGNDLEGVDYGYKLHLVYNILASPSARSHQTISGQIAPSTRTWQLNAVPPPGTEYRPTAHLSIDSTQVNPYLMEELETVLYGRSASAELAALPARLPTIQEIVYILANPITDTIEATI